MRSSPCLLAVLLLGCASSAPSPSAPEEGSGAPPFTIRLEARELELPYGQPPVLAARVINTSSSEQVFVEPVDSSTERARYPHYVWEVTRGDGSPVRELPVSVMCGNLNPIKPEEFVALAPGGERRLEGGWLRGPAYPFVEPGDYLVRLRYVLSAEQGPWGDGQHDGQAAEDVRALYARAYKGEVVSPPLRLRVRAMSAEHQRLVDSLPKVERGMRREAVTDLLGSPSQVLPGEDGRPAYWHEPGDEVDPKEPEFLIYLLTSSPAGAGRANVMDPVVTGDATPRIEVCLRPDGTVETARLLPEVDRVVELSPAVDLPTPGLALGLDLRAGRLLVPGEDGFQVWELDDDGTPRLALRAEADDLLPQGAQLSANGRLALLPNDDGDAWHVYRLTGERPLRVATLREGELEAGPAVFGGGFVWAAFSDPEDEDGVLVRRRLKPIGAAPAGRVALDACSAQGLVPVGERLLVWTQGDEASDYAEAVHSLNPATLALSAVEQVALPGCEWEPDDPAAESATSADGRWVLLGGGRGGQLWKVDAGRATHRATLVPEWRDVAKVDLSADGRLALLTCTWQVEVWRLDPDRAAPAQRVARLVGARSSIGGARFSPDGTRVFATAERGQLLRWDLPSDLRGR